LLTETGNNTKQTRIHKKLPTLFDMGRSEQKLVNLVRKTHMDRWVYINTSYIVR
jgi:hypothetical protein